RSLFAVIFFGILCHWPWLGRLTRQCFRDKLVEDSLANDNDSFLDVRQQQQGVTRTDAEHIARTLRNDNLPLITNFHCPSKLTLCRRQILNVHIFLPLAPLLPQV